MGRRRSSGPARAFAPIPGGARGALLGCLGLLVVAVAAVIVVLGLRTGVRAEPATAARAASGSANPPATQRRSQPANPASQPANPPATQPTNPPAGPTATTTVTGLVPPPPVEHRSPAARELAAVRRLASRGLPLYCGGRRKRIVALTFDDGPGVYTHYAIEKLRAAHIRATFFLVGRSILGWPGLAQRERAVAAFGDHTMTHPFLPALPLAAAIAQIRDARRLIARTVHERVLLFRPPYEGHTRAIDAAVKRLGMVEVLWDVDSADSLGGNYRDIERRVIAGLRPGSIILMHENHGQTIRALGAIIAALRRRHLRAVTVPQLIAQDPPTLSQLRRGFSGCPVRLLAGNGR